MKVPPIDQKDDKDDNHSISTNFTSISRVMVHAMDHHSSSHHRPAVGENGRSESLIDHSAYEETWMKKKKATKFFASMISCLYTLIVVIFSGIIEVSPVWQTDLWLGETIFFICMYGVGIVFLLFLYCVMIYPQPINFCTKLLAKRGWIDYPEKYHLEPVSHNGEGAGTLYLRLGALFFGCAGIVLFGLEIFLCFKNATCRNIVIAKHITGLLFTFLQMHFLFCNTKISIVRFKSLCKFGFMHLVAINLWTWFRFVLVKQTFKSHKKMKKKHMEQMKTEVSSSSSSSSSEESDIYSIGHGYLSDVANDTLEAVIKKTISYVNTTATTTPAYSFHTKQRMFSMENFGDLATFLTTCFVEYAVIGAAVIFIIWRSIDHPHHAHGESQKKRKYRMGMDCSHSSAGLFAGIMFFTAALVSMGVYTLFEQQKDATGTNLVFGIVDICLFSVALLACLLGFYQMRRLQYRLYAHGEVIDEILLIVGLTGEITYCTIGIDVFINNRRHVADQKSLLPIFVFITRLLQVAVQTVFILTVSRLRCLSTFAIKHKPGKQVITFLLVCNLTLFAFHTFEAMKQTYGIQDSADSTYLTIAQAVMPLLVFFRFHSSACLAEIWKHTYSSKEVPTPAHSHVSQSVPAGVTIIPIDNLPVSSNVDSESSDTDRKGGITGGKLLELILMSMKTTREYMELVISELLLKKYLEESFHFTPYSIISYIELGPRWDSNVVVTLAMASESTKAKKRKIEEITL